MTLIGLTHLNWVTWVLISWILFLLVPLMIGRIVKSNYENFAISGKKRHQGIRANNLNSQIHFVFLYSTNATIVGSCIFLGCWLQNNNGFGHLSSLPVTSLYDCLVILLQVLLILFIFDTQFYFIHRLMHTFPFLYKSFHRVHHAEIYPNVWNVIYHHPLDVFFGFASSFTWIVILSFHVNSYFIALFIVNYTVIAGHCGHEITRSIYNFISPLSWAAYLDPQRKGIARIFNTFTHHDLHHQRYNKNYSLYFTFWDYCFDTIAHDTDEIYFNSIKTNKDWENPFEYLSKIVYPFDFSVPCSLFWCAFLGG